MTRRLYLSAIAVVGMALVFSACSFLYQAQVSAQDSEVKAPVMDRMEMSKAFVMVAKKVKPAVVNIATSRKATMDTDRFHDFGDDFFRRFFPEQPSPRTPKKEYRQQGLGSGVIVDGKGYILTNNHVVREAEEIIVKLSDKREFPAKLVGADEKTDVAILKIEGSNLPVAVLGDSDNMAVGEWVLAIGNPFGLSQTVTAGIISAKGRAYVGVADYEDFIQTDAAINPGNSGGPLVNLAGEVIGINTAIASRSGGYQGVGFAIPVNMIKAIMAQIISQGKVTRGWLGVQIQPVTPELAKSFGLGDVRGALVADVAPNSPADKAGLKQGDIVLLYEGKEVEDGNHLRNMVAATEIGKKAIMQVFRGGKHFDVEVVIGDLGKADWGKLVPATEVLEEYGLELQELTPDLAKQFGYEEERGVLISGVKPDSPAERAGLSAGDLLVRVNQQKVVSIADVRKAVSGGGDRLLLLLRHGNSSRFVVIPRKK
jgi:serine protease Do